MPNFLSYALNGHKPRLSPWRTDKPDLVGWYLVCHLPGNWTYNEGAFAYWNGERWMRPYGWPSLADGARCMCLKSDTQIRFPKVSQDYLTSQCAHIVEVVRWCGLNHCPTEQE